MRIGVIFKHLRKLMDSLLEKKLENPRMNLEGKLKHHDMTNDIISRLYSKTWKIMTKNVYKHWMAYVADVVLSDNN